VKVFWKNIAMENVACKAKENHLKIIHKKITIQLNQINEQVERG